MIQSPWLEGLGRGVQSSKSWDFNTSAICVNLIDVTAAALNKQEHERESNSF